MEERREYLQELELIEHTNWTSVSKRFVFIDVDWISISDRILQIGRFSFIMMAFPSNFTSVIRWPYLPMVWVKNWLLAANLSCSSQDILSILQPWYVVLLFKSSTRNISLRESCSFGIVVKKWEWIVVKLGWSTLGRGNSLT